MLKLIIEDDEGRKTVVPFVRDEITIGRQEGNTIRLTERNVSRRHARLVRQNGHVLVEDLGSYNGIRINGDKIQGQVPVHDGDLIQIGDYDLAVQTEATQAAAAAAAATSPIVPVNASQGATPTDLDAVGDKPPQRQTAASSAMTMKLPDMNQTSPALPIVSDASQTLSGDEDGPEEADPDDVQSASGESDTGRRQSTAIIRMDQVEGNRPRQVVDIDPSEAPRLVVLNTEFAGREFACIRTELKIGRIEDNDIALDHRSLSRTHCKIVREDTGEWRVVDMQSANGLMVNGEPYAQSALRTGDTLELGHVKFKFVGPGEAFTLAPSSEGVQVKQSATRDSKAPMMAAAAVALVGLVGAVYWFGLRPKPIDKPVVVDEIAVNNPPDKEATPEQPEPRELTQEEKVKENTKKISDAENAIATLDWVKAKEILESCFVGESPCPQATQLLGQMNQEKGAKTSLEKAEKALQDGDLAAANDELNNASSTKLLRKRLAAAQTRYRTLVGEEVAATAAKKKDPVAEVKPVPVVPPEPQKPAAPDGQVFYEESRKLLKEKQLPAAKTQLEKCVKVAPRNFECHKLLGTVYARLDKPEQGLKAYKEFLRLAPPDHPAISQVQLIIDTYEKGLNK